MSAARPALTSSPMATGRYQRGLTLDTSQGDPSWPNEAYPRDRSGGSGLTASPSRRSSPSVNQQHRQQLTVSGQRSSQGSEYSGFYQHPNGIQAAAAAVSAATSSGLFSNHSNAVASIHTESASNKRYESIQRKLQRAYQEKNLMLAQIQTLRKLVDGHNNNNSNNSSNSASNTHYIDSKPSTPVGSGLPSDSAGVTPYPTTLIQSSEQPVVARLLEANIRAGTLACVWCIKTQLIRRLSQAFYHWKLAVSTMGERDGTLKAAPSHPAPSTPALSTLSHPPREDEQDEDEEVSEVMDWQGEGFDEKRRILLMYASKIANETFDETSSDGDDNHGNGAFDEEAKESRRLVPHDQRRPLQQQLQSEPRSRSGSAARTETRTGQPSVSLVDSDWKPRAASATRQPSYLAPTASYQKHLDEKWSAWMTTSSSSAGSAAATGSKTFPPRSASQARSSKGVHSHVDQSKSLRRQPSPPPRVVSQPSMSAVQPALASVTVSRSGRAQPRSQMVNQNMDVDPVVERYVSQSNSVADGEAPGLTVDDMMDFPPEPIRSRQQHRQQQQSSALASIDQYLGASTRSATTLNSRPAGRAQSPSPRYLVPTTASRKKATSPKYARDTNRSTPFSASAAMISSSKRLSSPSTGAVVKSRSPTDRGVPSYHNENAVVDDDDDNRSYSSLSSRDSHRGSNQAKHRSRHNGQFIDISELSDPIRFHRDSARTNATTVDMNNNSSGGGGGGGGNRPHQSRGNNANINNNNRQPQKQQPVARTTLPPKHKMTKAQYELIYGTLDENSKRWTESLRR